MREIPRFAGIFAAQPPLVRLAGERVVLRPPERGDWQAWTELRAASRAFLKPWEPSWAADALNKPAFRRRLARYVLECRDGHDYNLFTFLPSDERLLRGP